MIRRRVLQWLSGSGSPGSASGSVAVAELVRGLKARWPRAGIAVEPDFVTVWTDGVGVGIPTGRLCLLEAERPARVVFEQAHLMAEVARVLARPAGAVLVEHASPVVIPQWRVERSDDGALRAQRLVPGLDVAYGRWTDDPSGRGVLLLDTQRMAVVPGLARAPDGGLPRFNPLLSEARYALRRVGVAGVEARVWTLPDAEPLEEPKLAASRLLEPWGWGGGAVWSPGMVVAIPCSDRLWVAHDTDPEACAWVLERSWEDWLGRTHALIPRPLLRTGTAWELWEGHA